MKPSLPTNCLTPKRLVSLAAIITLGSLLIIANICYRSAESYLVSTSSDGNPRIHLIESVLSSLKDAERAHRGFLLTMQDSYLNTYRAACEQIDADMARLRAYTKQTSYEEAQEVSALGELVNVKLKGLGSSLEIRRDAGLQPAMQAVAGEDEINSWERIRNLITTIEAKEISRQDRQAREVAAKAAFHQNLTIGLVGMDLVFLVAVGLLGVKINRLQHLVTVCAWSHEVEYKGQWMPFEQFLQQRFGVRVSHGISEEQVERLYDQENLPHDAEDLEGASAIH